MKNITLYKVLISETFIFIVLMLVIFLVYNYLDKFSIIFLIVAYALTILITVFYYFLSVKKNN